jgi:excisionase family DNA binding protein
MSKPNLSAQELALLLEIDRRTLYRWVDSGRITAGRTLSGQLVFRCTQVQQDYERAGATLPDTFAAYLKSDEAKPSAETRGAA